MSYTQADLYLPPDYIEVTPPAAHRTSGESHSLREAVSP